MVTELTPPFDISKYEDPNEIFNEAYLKFQIEFSNRNKRPNLYNRFIFIDESVGYEDKINGFWHLASIGGDDLNNEANIKYDMDPCINDNANGKCKYLCEINHSDNFMKEENSIPCIYRVSRIMWTKEIIELINKNPNHNNIKIWKQKNTKTKENTLKIRYIKEQIDYIIILKISYNKNNNDINCYRLITAYPVVLRSYKKRFDKEYEKYMESKSKK